MNEYAERRTSRQVVSGRRRLAARVLFGLAVIGTLSACSVGASSSDEVEVHSAPTATAAPLPGDANGDGKLSEFEKQVHASKAPRDYPIPDGSVAVIDPMQPLPERVKQVIAEEAVPVVAPMKATSDGDVMSAVHYEMRVVADAQAKATGKNIVYVFSGQGASGTAWLTLASGRNSTGLVAESTKDAMLPKVQSWADSMGYEVIAME